MSRVQTPAAARVYAAAQRFVEAALRTDDSLFTPGSAIWSPTVIADLYTRFVEHPDQGADTFEAKFRRQLRGDALTPPQDAPPATYQLAGELLYIHLLPVNGIKGQTKRRIITTTLDWSPAPVAIPAEFKQALDQGVARAGQYFILGRPFQLWFLIEFIKRWKERPSLEWQQFLSDPWSFKNFLATIPVNSAYAQRDLLLHLVYPETFEPIMSREHKQKIAEAFVHLVETDIDDIDQQLLQIRARLTPEYGEGFSFYDDRIKPMWQSSDQFSSMPEIDEKEMLLPNDHQGVTGAAAGLSGADQIRIALEKIDELGGTASMRQITEAVQNQMGHQKLSHQGLSSLRFFINQVAVDKGYLSPYDKTNPGWHITPKGHDFLDDSQVDQERNVQLAVQDTQREEQFTQLPSSLGRKLLPYVTLAASLNRDAYTAEEIAAVLRSVTPEVASGFSDVDPDQLVDDLLRLRLLESLGDGRYQRWGYLADGTHALLLRYAALTLLVPEGDEAYRLPALDAPFDGIAYPPDAWPIGAPLLAWYEEAGLVQHNTDGTWRATPNALTPLDDQSLTAQAINTFLSNLRLARSSPKALPPLRDQALPTLPPAVLAQRIAEIQRELLIDRETIMRIYRSLIAGHHVILSGPPGTGKTHLARLLPRILWRDITDTVLITLPNDPSFPPTASPVEEPLRREGYLTEVVTATEDWGVRHLIGGIVPKIQRNEQGSTLVYSISHGYLTSAVLSNYDGFEQGQIPDQASVSRREAIDDNGNRYQGTWLVIDEFTRAQIDAAFGGLLTALGGQRPTLAVPTDDGSRPLTLPRDFRLVGTLNSFDRHFLNQISEAMKRRFTFIDILPPGRDRADDERAIAIYGALRRLAEHSVAGFQVSHDLGRASWNDLLEVKRIEQPNEATALVRYEVNARSLEASQAIANLWRVFSAARVYRQLGTAQAEAAYATLFAGYSIGMSWSSSLDAALADTLADQLQVLARDEQRVLLALLEHPVDSDALRKALVATLDLMPAPRRLAHLLQLRAVAPEVDTNQLAKLTNSQIETIFGSFEPLLISSFGLFAQRLIAFASEKGL